jgi:hypothetical protein
VGSTVALARTLQETRAAGDSTFYCEFSSFFFSSGAALCRFGRVRLLRFAETYFSFPVPRFTLHPMKL